VPQETKLGRFVTEISFAYDLQSHRTTQVNVERFVGDAHCPTTQLDRLAILIQHHLIVLKPSNLRPTVSPFGGVSC
jgi:hypothetical protein